jgi:2-polyprenyl-3-methyl-5-hydroxy-6-metoxy-1,4-benzoquinol methylase
VNESPHYLQPYEEAVKNYGGTFDATLWHSKEGQVKRFDVFCGIVDFTNCSILDVGCGIGDFAQYLVEKNIHFSSFYGIDAMPEMIDTADDRSIPNTTFSVVDVVKKINILPPSDWITCSGTLNAMGEALAIKVIDALFDHCTVGLAFNFLSNQNRNTYQYKCGEDPATEDLYPASRFNTIELLRYAMQKTPLVSFTQTYMGGHDATIVMTRK